MTALPTYLQHVPSATVQPGEVIVHNSLRHTRRLGYHGFRAWSEPPRAELVICGYGRAPELPEHYRVETLGRAPGAPV